jgi:quinol monooxygenase YgiN
MAILVLLEAKTKPEAVESLKAFLRPRLPQTRAYDGCHGITMYLDPRDGRTFVFVEYWDSTAHYERYLAWRQETGELAQLFSMLEGEPSIRYFDAVDV